VNTILQLFDYLSQTSVVIAATNQKEMLDSALVRRFDVALELNLPTMNQIEDLVNLTLRNEIFSFDKPSSLKSILSECLGLSFYSIQKTLITAIKRSLISSSRGGTVNVKPIISTKLWKNLIASEKQALNVLNSES
jgi:AAA+ superfamily predicted ATPase